MCYIADLVSASTYDMWTGPVDVVNRPIEVPRGKPSDSYNVNFNHVEDDISILNTISRIEHCDYDPCAQSHEIDVVLFSVRMNMLTINYIKHVRGYNNMILIQKDQT